MNPPDPLAELNPLREPLMVSWWPPAPGWWIISLLVLLGIILIGIALRRRHRKNAYRRTALSQLQTLHDTYHSEGDTSRYLSSVNALLKSVALHAYPRVDVASQSGADWLQIINQDLPDERQLGEEFNDAVYRKITGDLDVSPLFPAAQYWITHHKVTS